MICKKAADAFGVAAHSFLLGQKLFENMLSHPLGSCARPSHQSAVSREKAKKLKGKSGERRRVGKLKPRDEKSGSARLQISARGSKRKRRSDASYDGVAARWRGLGDRGRSSVRSRTGGYFAGMAIRLRFGSLSLCLCLPFSVSLQRSLANRYSRAERGFKGIARPIIPD